MITIVILITGGAGFIGSHTSIELIKAGYEIIIIDNFSNSHPTIIQRIQQIAGKQIKFYQMDLLNEFELDRVFQENTIDAVIHFAGLKAVGDSVKEPLTYFKINLFSTINLCQIMQKYSVKNIVFSSSATVYGVPEKVPIYEDFPLKVNNPYGRTKLMIEEMLQDLYLSDPDWSITILRYFNPIGAHESGLIGEEPTGIPNNLLPFITKVAIGALSELKVFGHNYSTFDGTGIRDYVHVVDLALGHIAALEKVMESKRISTYNLGTGKGHSVLEVIKAFEKVSGVKIPFQLSNPRPGDVAFSFADSTKAKLELGWIAKKGIEEMCKDAWNWQINSLKRNFKEKITTEPRLSETRLF